MQEIFVKLDTAGSDTGPFMIYSNVDGYITAYGINISKAALLLGAIVTVPDFTTSVKIRSNGKCTNSIIVNIPPLGPTTTSTSTTSTSTTSTSTTTSTTTLQPATTTSTTSTSTTTSTTTIPLPPVTGCTCQKSIFNPPDGQPKSVSYYDCEINPKTGQYSLITETISPGAERCINIDPSAITPSGFFFTPISGTGCPTCGPVPACLDGCKRWTFTIPIGSSEGITYKKCDGTTATALLSGVYCICDIPIAACPDCIALAYPFDTCK